ncbi:MAG TPA: creatininase family protein [Alphaproteobacteria bacterium]|nr:creatininase family protein [Alphaproteobacteria bacterium]
MTTRLWQELTTEDVAALDRARTVAILPVAAIEQHGPHLPLGTDALINEGVLARALALVPPDLPAVVLPMLSVGASGEHSDFAGTLSLSAKSLLDLVTEVAEGVARAGLRKLVLFNSHGGQPQVLEMVAQDLRTRRAMVVVAANAWRMMEREAVLPPAEREAGLHGGGLETALMLHLRPDLVRSEKIRDFPSRARGLERDFPSLAAHGRLAFAWQAQDLNPAGAVGDARLGTAEMGRKLVDSAAARLVRLVEELARFPLEAVDRRA